MAWTLTEDLDAFLRAAGGFLAAHAAENTVLLTVAEGIRTGGRDHPELPPRYGWWRPAAGGPVEGAYLRSLPGRQLLGRMPAAAGSQLAVALARAGEQVTDVGGAVDVAEAFAAAWRDATGGAATVRRHERLYRLAGLSAPDPAPPGAARIAGPGDRDLLTEWYEAFLTEVEDEGLIDVRASVERRIDFGGLFLWEDGGRPVAMAGVSRKAAGMVRVGPVYTPPELRGRGYAAGATAAASAAGLERGAGQVLLFTDLANPTSNALYQRLGFRPVRDRLVLSFADAAVVR